MSLAANTTVNGLKQTIANMLQMRAPGHHDKTTVEAGYTGPVISENGTATFPPSGYYAHVPSGVLNEFAIKIDYNSAAGRMWVKPFIEIICPFHEGWGGGNVTIQVKIQSITYSTANGTFNLGPYTLTTQVDLSQYRTGGSFRKCVLNGKRVQAVAPDDNMELRILVPGPIIGNPIVIMGDVKLFSGTSNSSVALRDWLKGSFINQQLGDGASLALNTPLTVTNYISDPNCYKPNFNSSNVTLQRIDPRIKGETSWVVAPHTFPTGNSSDSITTYFGGSGPEKVLGHNTWYAGYGIKPTESATRDIPGDPSSRGDNESDFWTATERPEAYFIQKLNTLDATSSNASLTNATFNTPHDLGKVPTNVNWRRLRFMPRHKNENTKNLLPDWAMLDVMSFSSNNSSRSILKIAPINPNGSFALDTSLNNSTTIPSPRNNLAALIKPLESSTPTNFKLGSSIARAGTGANMTFDVIDMSTGITYQDPYEDFRGNATMATSISSNITSNSTTKWSTLNSTWSAWRTARNWPSTLLILPGEVTEIQGVADYAKRSQYHFGDYNGNGIQLNNSSIKENEGRLSAFFPGLTTCSNFFTVYAYAQAGQLQNKTQPESASNPFIIDSESLTKTLVEVEITTPATATAPAEYKVKKLYSQNLPMGD
jgi:hypothetical protein